MKKIVVPTIVVTILWMVMDFIFHGQLLHGMYMETSNLWRPMEDMSMACSVAFTVVFSFIFTLFYSEVIADKSPKSGARFGAMAGALLGVSMSSSYMYMPIPAALAIAWFAIVLIESTVAGAVVGYLTRNS